MFPEQLLVPGKEYSIVTELEPGQSTVLFSGVAGYLPDDFIAAGIMKRYLDEDTFVGYICNEHDEPGWLDAMKALHRQEIQE